MWTTMKNNLLSGGGGERIWVVPSICISSSSALQLFMSFGLLNYFFPLFPLLRPLFPVLHSHLSQVISRVVFPSLSWPSFRSCCVQFPFIYSLGHSFVWHSFYMSQPAQPFAFNVSYYIFCLSVFQFHICFESPLSICLLCWAEYSSQYPHFEYQ
jgi:hypothetical protein